jgi:hypothetical protein
MQVIKELDLQCMDAIESSIDTFELLKELAVTENITLINPLNTKRRPLYLKDQSVPCCKHSSSRL